VDRPGGVSSDLHAGPAGGGGVDGGVLAQECNGGGVQVVPLLSAGGSGGVEQTPVHEHAALGGVQAEGREDLDGLAGCGIIGTHVLCTIDAVQLPLDGVVLYRASHPGESSLENENGRRPGIVQERRPFGVGGCSIVDWSQASLCIV